VFKKQKAPRRAPKDSPAEAALTFSWSASYVRVQPRNLLDLTIEQGAGASELASRGR
jgi:hypothetical protein